MKKFIRNHLRNQRGSTLVEVLVSLALFAIVAIFILSTLLTGITIVSSAKSKSQNSMKTAGGLAQKTENQTVSDPQGTTVSSSSGNFTMTLTDSADGSQITVTVPGSFLTGTTSGKNPGESVTYKSFSPSDSGS
ncbi:MAG TPA: prepilin-type N-terminal cleavage/methylation domain-containing protein [Clostridia bacterium]|nr:prepilin-type N-terminal cleavage/methylation domain-containing protein [Clostridia bacterium]